MKNLLRKYRRSLWSNCIGGRQEPSGTVKYWQNHLFASTMELVVPLSLITLVPGLIYSIIQALPLMLAANIASVLLIFYIAFAKGVSTATRKVLLISCSYFAGLYYLIYLGYKGPGFLFLYSACIFAILILPVHYAYLWSWINVALCALLTLVVHFNLSPVAEVNEISALEWMGISMHLLYLSFFTSFILPKLFRGISASFKKQKILQKRLSRNQKSLEKALLQYSNLFHLSPQPMWVYSLETLNFLDVNEAAVKHYGYTHEEFMQMKIHDIRPDSEIPRVDQNMSSLLDKNKHSLNGEDLHTKKNGTQIIVDIRSNIIDYDGQKSVVVLATDISERYRHIEAIEGQNTKLREIAWMQSHIVRAPLAKIMGIIQLLKYDELTEAEKEDLLQHLFCSAQDFDAIVRDIADKSSGIEA